MNLIWNDFNKYERGNFKLSKDISHSSWVKYWSTSLLNAVVYNCSNAWSTTWKQKSFIYKKDCLSIRGRQVNRSITSLWSNLEQRWNIYFELASLWNIIKYCSTFPEPISSKILVSATGQLQKYSIYFFDKGSSISNSVRPVQSDHRSASLKLLDRIHSNVLYILLALPT